MDYPVAISSQLQQLLRSLRKSRKMTQADLARRLDVVQSRVADIERAPGAVSVEQLLQVLAMLGAQMVVRENNLDITTTQPGIHRQAHAQANAAVAAPLTTAAKPAPSAPDADAKQDGEPRGQW